MLGSFSELLQQRPLPVDEIRATLQAQQFQWDDYPSISGSFKTIYALNHEVAVASVKADNKDMLSKEKILLAKLLEHGLPAIQYYSEVFELHLDKPAVLLQWIPNSILIDVKDFESAPKNLIYPALGIDLPVSGEAWALYKDEVDQKINKLFLDFPLMYTLSLIHI